MSEDKKKSPYATVAIHHEQDKMLDSVAHFCGLSKMELVELFVKSAHKSLAWNFKKLGIEAINMRFSIAVKTTLAPMPTAHSIACPMSVPNEKVDKIIEKDMKKKGLLEK